MATFASSVTAATSGLEPASAAKAAAARAAYTTGGTNTGGALSAAQDALARGTAPRKIVVLLTDGQPDDDAAAVAAAAALKRSGATVVTVGVRPLDSEGMDEAMLSGLASTDAAGRALYARADGFAALVPTLQALTQRLC